MPWESEGAIENEVFKNRYLHYNDWEVDYGWSWEEDHEFDRNDKFLAAQVQSPPDSDEEDDASLKALLQRLGR